MKTVPVVLALLFGFSVVVSAPLHSDPPPPSYEQELNKLSTDLGSSLGSAHVKVISISNFTDLYQGDNDLGKLLVEDLTVDLANQNKELTIIDHSLTDPSSQDQKID